MALANELLGRLTSYAAELDGIRDRFTRSRDGIHISSDDDPRYRELAIEIRDLLSDSFPNDDYADQVAASFQEGINNFFGSPSLRSVETIRGIVKAAAVRTRNKSAEVAKNQADEVKPLPLPERVTLSWLAQHVPISFWFWAVGIITGAYLLGVKTSGFARNALGL